MMLLIAFGSNGSGVPIFAPMPVMIGIGKVRHGKIPYAHPRGDLGEQKMA
jgi:hypothetical protein